MKSKDEVMNDTMSGFDGQIPSVRQYMKSRFNGVWENGYCHGFARGVKVGEEKAYNQGFNAGQLVPRPVDDENYDLGFKAGMNAAWDVARKIRHPSYSGIFEDERKEIFGYENSDDILTLFIASEALEALHEHELKKAAEEKQKQPEKHDWKVGDFVYDSSGNFCMITQVGTHIHVLYPNGKTHKWSKGTRFRNAADKHLDFAKILKLVSDAEQA